MRKKRAKQLRKIAVELTGQSDGPGYKKAYRSLKKGWNKLSTPLKQTFFNDPVS